MGKRKREERRRSGESERGGEEEGREREKEEEEEEREKGEKKEKRKRGKKREKRGRGEPERKRKRKEEREEEESEEEEREEKRKEKGEEEERKEKREEGEEESDEEEDEREEEEEREGEEVEGEGEERRRIVDSEMMASIRKAQNIDQLFPMQREIIGVIEGKLSSRSKHGRGDLCICAPTGSGKTLSYVVPIVSFLRDRLVRRLRALVLLPTRDLAQQVYDVFESVIKHVPGDLKVGLIMGQTHYRKEQLALFSHTTSNEEHKRRRKQGEERSAFDILIATPGRLVDHMEYTPAFTLEHLRYLVVDEADRLLAQDYQGWLAKILNSAHRWLPDSHFDLSSSSLSSSSSTAIPLAPKTEQEEEEEREEEEREEEEREEEEERGFSSIIAHTNRRPTSNYISVEKSHLSSWLTSSSLSPEFLLFDFIEGEREKREREGRERGGRELLGEGRERRERERGGGWEDEPIQKLMFSATLTQNPDKIASLKLNNPLYLSYGGPFSTALEKALAPSKRRERKREEREGEGEGEEETRFFLPPSLSQLMIVCEGGEKPLVFEQLMKKYNSILCFTRSVETAHRLALLLHLLGHSSTVAEFVGSLPQKERRSLITQMKQGEKQVLICSDVIARGMDLPNVSCVVNYDVPLHLKTYVHRVGRTARAGAKGETVSLLEKKQVYHFKKMIQKAGNSQIKSMKIPQFGEERVQKYQSRLKELERRLARETAKSKRVNKKK